MANSRKKFRAEYLYPGSFMPEECYRDLPEPTFEAAVEHGPDDIDGYFTKDGWYAVQISTIIEHRVRNLETGVEFWMEASRTRESYIIGRLVHYESPELAHPRHEILRSNIRSNSRDPLKGYGVLTRCGNWQIASDWDYVKGSA